MQNIYIANSSNTIHKQQKIDPLPYGNVKLYK